MTAAAPFDAIAPRYDELWTNTTAGRLQRDAVWRKLESYFRAGHHLLDLGCGTGEDALHLEQAGVRVSAFDASPGMVQVARERGIAANVLTLEDLDKLDGAFDGALSNFGALNCVAEPHRLRAPLARLIRPGGFLALCVIGRFCLWETAHFLMRGELRKATRRWSGSSTSASLNLQVFYPTTERLCKIFAPDFTLIESTGIGVFVPPSYAGALPTATLANLAAADRRIAHLPGVRALADHRLLIFKRC
jgi:ubiquinone/menaquinone biosynthesis C-methylase UbiE